MRQELLAELNNLTLDDEHMAKVAIANLREVLKDVPAEMHKDFPLDELEELYKNKICPLTRKCASEEADKIYSDDELIALIAFYRTNPWAVQKAIKHQMASNARVQVESANIINRWWDEKEKEAIRKKADALVGQLKKL